MTPIQRTKLKRVGRCGRLPTAFLVSAESLSSSYYGVRNLLPGPSTICCLHEGNHITFTYTASWLREENRAVICKRPTERGRDEIETIDAFKRRLDLHLCPMFPAVAGCIEGLIIRSTYR